MSKPTIVVKKSSGEKVAFSLDKLRASLLRSGANESDVQHIIDVVRDELYQGISTREIYNRAFALLKKKKSIFASKYKLKKAIYELGPTGFPFERFVGQVLYYSGYKTEVGLIISGKCVQHEVDVVAQKEGITLYIECKFHGEEGRNCNVKIPLYIHSRYHDIIDKQTNGDTTYTEGWVVTNTRFTSDAVEYGSCVGLKLLSWDYPKDNGIKDRIDRLGLYPITVSTLLTKREKNFLLGRDIVLCKQLLNDRFYLDHLGISDTRKSKILNEIALLCHDNNATTE
mgnify:CR=1 FL=1|tara:strand:- start:52133 stop:52984 length:852 start_codon:yes stop_codon:yes gene_type:complete